MSSVSAHSILLPIISDNGIDLDHDQENRQLLCSAFAPSLQLLSSLKRFPHPLKSHSSPWRPHCMTVPELLEREDRGREEGVVADRLGWWTPDRDWVLVEDEVEEV